MITVVTGCPRSGTASAARYYGLGHEKLNDKGISSWVLASRAKGAVPWGPSWSQIPEGRKIIHQVRSPLACISSMTTISSLSWDYIYSRCSVNPDDSLPERCMSLWVLWNRMAEKLADETVRVEDLDCLNTTLNKRNHVSYTSEYLMGCNEALFGKVCKLASKYGYEL